MPLPSELRHLGSQITCWLKLKLKIVFNSKPHQRLRWSQETFTHLSSSHFVSILSWQMFHIYQVSFCEGKTSLLESILKIGLDFICPFRVKTVCPSNPLRISLKLIKLIRGRQKSIKIKNMVEFRRFRNQVNRERKSSGSKFYFASIKRKCWAYWRDQQPI